MTPPDMLRFYLPSGGTHEVGWNGPWPPPDRLTLAIGQESGMVRVIDRATSKPEDLEALDACETITQIECLLANASTLPDDFHDAHIFRGAEYRVEP